MDPDSSYPVNQHESLGLPEGPPAHQPAANKCLLKEEGLVTNWTVPTSLIHIPQIALHKEGPMQQPSGKPLEHIAWVMRGVCTAEMHDILP